MHGAYLRGSANTPAITSACVAGALVSKEHSGTCGTCCGKYPMPSCSGIGGRSDQLIGPYCRPLSTARPAQEQYTSAYSQCRDAVCRGWQVAGIGTCEGGLRMQLICKALSYDRSTLLQSGMPLTSCSPKRGTQSSAWQMSV